MRIDSNSTPSLVRRLQAYATTHEQASTRRPRAPPLAPSPGCSIAETVAISAGHRRSWMYWARSRAPSERAAHPHTRATSTWAPGAPERPRWRHRPGARLRRLRRLQLVPDARGSTESSRILAPSAHTLASVPRVPEHHAGVEVLRGSGRAVAVRVTEGLLPSYRREWGWQGSCGSCWCWRCRKT